jgi:hypothetical protein
VDWFRSLTGGHFLTASGRTLLRFSAFCRRFSHLRTPERWNDETTLPAAPRVKALCSRMPATDSQSANPTASPPPAKREPTGSRRPIECRLPAIWEQSRVKGAIAARTMRASSLRFVQMRLTESLPVAPAPLRGCAVPTGSAERAGRRLPQLPVRRDRWLNRDSSASPTFARRRRSCGRRRAAHARPRRLWIGPRAGAGLTRSTSLDPGPLRPDDRVHPN